MRLSFRIPTRLVGVAVFVNFLCCNAAVKPYLWLLSIQLYLFLSPNQMSTAASFCILSTSMCGVVRKDATGKRERIHRLRREICISELPDECSIWILEYFFSFGVFMDTYVMRGLLVHFGETWYTTGNRGDICVYVCVCGGDGLDHPFSDCIQGKG